MTPALRQVLFGGSRGGQYDASAQNIFDRMAAAGSAPDAAHMGYINTCVLALKAASVWTKIDSLQVYAAQTQTQAMIDWKTGSIVPTLGNAPTFTADSGFVGNGTPGTGAGTMYIDTGYNPSTFSGAQYAANSAFVCNWGINNTDDTFMRDVGQMSTGAGLSTVLNARSSNNIRGVLNEATGFSNYGGSVTTSVGLAMFRRVTSGAGSVNADFNGSFQGNGGGAVSSTVPTVNLSVLGDVSTASRYSNRGSRMFAAGGGLNSTESTAFYNAMRAYMTSVGVP